VHPQSILITWSEIDSAQNGGDAVIYYKLEWDQGSNSWEELTTYTAGGPI